MKETNKKIAGFTLIELLIVVAIIAILAAIAVPNFLEAQVRAKVSRSQADMRSQAVALEAYFVDYNQYTRDSDSSLDTIGQGATASVAYTDLANGIVQLTTPISYITSILKDPFAPTPQGVGAGGGAMGYRIASGSWSYGCPSTSAAGQAATYSDNQKSKEAFAAMGAKPCYALIGVGPDQNRNRIGYKCFPFMGMDTNEIDSGAITGHSAADAASLGLLNPAKKFPMSYITYDPSNGTKSMGDIYKFGGSFSSGRFVLDGKIIGSQDAALDKTGTANTTAVW